MRKHSQAEEENEINMTPMLDIVFIMLIFFIVTAVFVKEAGVEVNKIDAETTRIQKQVSILVGIDSESRIFIERKEVELEQVKPTIEQLYAENPKGTITIQADSEARSETAVKVYNAIKKAGVEIVAFSTEKK